MSQAEAGCVLRHRCRFQGRRIAQAMINGGNGHGRPSAVVAQAPFCQKLKQCKAVGTAGNGQQEVSKPLQLDEKLVRFLKPDR